VYRFGSSVPFESLLPKESIDPTKMKQKLAIYRASLALAEEDIENLKKANLEQAKQLKEKNETIEEKTRLLRSFLKY
jgi:multidrug resistance efflux pump